MAPTYTLSVKVPTFDAVKEGYAQPAARPIMITSTGNNDATISSVALDNTNFTIISTSGNTTVTAGGTNTTYEIQPVIGLKPGLYTATITVTYNGGATATATVSFTVNAMDTVATPSFSPVEGEYKEVQNVTISCATDGATIYYTTDESEPTVNSTPYSSPISVSATATIKAIAVKNGMKNSEVASAAYIITPEYTISAAVSPAGSGTVEGAGTYKQGATATLTARANESYKFVNWTEENGAQPITDNPYSFTVAGERNLTANFEKQAFTITWLMDDDSVIDTTTVEYGTVPTHDAPTKEPTAGKTYVFSGWTPDVVAAAGDATYKAVFSDTTNSYTITWQDDEGKTIDTTTVEYGKVPTHAEPIREATAEYTYTFAGWDPAPVAVTGNATYKAKFTGTKRSYTITWLMDDDSVIDTSTVEYGTVPTHADPAKAETAEYTYTFKGWTPEVVAVTGDATYKATFTAEKITPPGPVIEPGQYYFDPEATTVYWMKGSSQGALFTVHRVTQDELAFSLFRRVMVDSRTLTLQEYSASAGSVRILLNPGYLNKLAVGAYTLTAEFEDGIVSTPFYVISSGGSYYSTSTSERYTYVPPSNNPRTGDDSHLALWGALACLSAAGVILTAKKRKRRDY